MGGTTAKCQSTKSQIALPANNKIQSSNFSNFSRCKHYIELLLLKQGTTLYGQPYLIGSIWVAKSVITE